MENEQEIYYLIRIYVVFITRNNYRKYFSLWMMGVLSFLSFVALIPFIFISIFIISKGIGGLSLSFFTDIPHPPGVAGGGMGNAIVGSMTVVGMASLIGIPWGVGAGIFMSEYSYHWLSYVLRFIVDLFTSVPSIVIGIFIYHLVVVYYGFSAYAGALALTFIMLPIVAKSTEEILKLIPQHIREAGLALGLPRWKMIMSILIPGTASMLVTGVILAIARISGETAPLLFTALGNQFYSQKLSEPISTLPVQIYEFAKSGFEELENLAWSGALVLIVFVFLINLLVRASIFIYQKGYTNELTR